MGRITLRASAGFTLLELLVVLLLLALVYGLAVPMFSAGQPGTELKGATRQIAAGLRQARNEAVRQKEEAVLVLDVEKRNFMVSGDRRRYNLPASLVYTLVTAQSDLRPDGVGAIRFYPDGSSNGGRITVAFGTRKYEINVDWLTGRVTVLN